MGTDAKSEVKRTVPWVCFPTLPARNFAIAFGGLILLQALILLLLGTGRPGRGISALILVVDNLLAIACAYSAFRRARSLKALAWLLYGLSLLLLLIPTAIGALDILFDRSTVSPSTWRVLFCLYGAPLLMMLSLPETERERTKPEIVLDLLQVLLVAGLVFGTFFLLPVMRLLPSEAQLRYVSLSNLQSLFLLGAVGARLLVARFDGTRDLIIRVGVFVLSCATVTFFGNWVDLHQSAQAAAWFDLGWGLPLVVGGLVARSWVPPAVATSESSAPRFIHYLATNLTIVSLLCICVAILMGPWKVVHSGFFIAVAVGVSWFAFVWRLSLTQHQQQVEIAQRKAAEEGLRTYESIVEYSQDAIIGKDNFGIITSWNPAAERVYGYSRAEAVGRNVSVLFPPDRLSELSTMLELIASGQSGQGLESKRVTKTGALLDVSLTVSPLKDVNGRVVGASTIARDITLNKRAEERLKLQAAALDAAANAIVITDQKGNIAWTNRAFTILTGYSREEVRGENVRILRSKAQDDAFYARLWSTISAGNVWQGELINRRKDGTTYIEEMSIMPVTPELGNTTDRYFIAVKQDITLRKQIEQTLLFKNALLEAQAETTLDGILVVDDLDHIVLANRQFGLHFSIPDDLLKTNDDHVVLEHLLSKVQDPETFAKKVKHLYRYRDERSRDEFRLENGKVFDRYSAPLVDSTGVYRGRIWYFRDITEHRLAAERVQYLAYYDGLTGLPNRTLFRDHLTKVLAGARRQSGKIAIMFLDLDGFKNINDSLGHSIGDLLLQQVAQRLKRWGREQDTIARFGGDEFLILLTDVKNIHDTAAAAERLMDTMTAEFLVQGHSIHISCSVGISIFPEHGADGETLISNADTAMYSAKASGRNTFRYFTKDMNAGLVERMNLEKSLRVALERNELFLVYQPQMDIATGSVCGLEALLRWQHPTLGLVPPDKFIPIAENSGLILPIGEWVLRTVCRQARQWQDEGLPAFRVAVNISAVQFRQENFCALIRRVLNESDLSPRYLELELTESILLENADVMLSVVRELNAMGLGIAIDDFGTGYSSFSYLRQFRAQRLKIDRSFIQYVTSKSDDDAIAIAIISMAKSLNLKVIAEGVENEAQLTFLRDHHCDEIQGYYFNRPLTVEKVAERIRELAAKCAMSGPYEEPVCNRYSSSVAVEF